MATSNGGNGLMRELDLARNGTPKNGDAPRHGVAVNAHLHLPPNFSSFRDATEAVDLAAAQGVGVLGVNNYYDYNVYGEFSELARERGVFPLFGMELIVKIDELLAQGVRINDPGNPGKMYVCGKGISRYDEQSTEAGRLLGNMRARDTRRAAEMLQRAVAWLREHGVALQLDLERVIDMIVEAHGTPRGWVVVQERHVAQALQQALFDAVPAGEHPALFEKLFGAGKRGVVAPVAVQNMLRSELLKSGKPAFVEESFLGIEEGRRLILELGGVPCYPVLADGVAPITGFEATPEVLIGRLREYGFHWVEFIPLRNTPEVLEQYVVALRAAGFVVTGGTEHNTLDKVAIEPLCIEGAAVPEAVQDIFWEGACVAAAHQFLCAHGELGYTDGEGNLNPGYADSARIAEFKQLGESVIARFHEKFKKS